MCVYTLWQRSFCHLLEFISFLLHIKLIQIAPATDIHSDFKCDTCEATFDIADVKETKKIVSDAIKLADKTSPDDFETILDTYKDILPPNASAFLEIKYALLQLYGNPNGKCWLKEK